MIGKFMLQRYFGWIMGRKLLLLPKEKKNNTYNVVTLF